MAFVKKRSPGAKTWSVVYDYIDDNGVKKKKWESGFATQKLANARKAEIENAQAGNHFIAPSRMTVSELFDKVVSIYGAKTWEPKTYELNEGLIRNHIKPHIGEMPLQKVMPLDIEQMFQQLRETKVLRGKGEDRPCLSSTTLRLIHGMVKQGFALAVDWNLLRENPVRMAPPPRSTREACIWTPDEMFHALDEMKTKHDQLYLAVHTAFVCAMRIGEAVGLRWSNVDFAHDLITINRTLQRVQKSALEALYGQEDIIEFPTSLDDVNSVLILKKPKTKGSNRTIRMPPRLKHDLLMRKQLVAKQKAYHGKAYQDHDLVFCLDDGRPVEPKLCEKWFIKFQKRSEGGYPKIKFHEIRHSIATFLVILSGGNPAAVQKVTGHQSPDILLRIYNHATKDMVNELAGRFEEVFYAQDDARQEAAGGLQEIPKKRILELVDKFDHTMDQPPASVQTQKKDQDLESSILELLDQNPEMRERLLLKLAMQPTQILRE